MRKVVISGNFTNFHVCLENKKEWKLEWNEMSLKKLQKTAKCTQSQKLISLKTLKLISFEFRLGFKKEKKENNIRILK